VDLHTLWKLSPVEVVELAEADAEHFADRVLRSSFLISPINIDMIHRIYFPLDFSDEQARDHSEHAGDEVLEGLSSVEL